MSGRFRHQHSQAFDERRDKSLVMLTSVEIRRFRAFRELSVERLGRVNLVVGKNSVGKTTLLEAISLYRSGLAAGFFAQKLLERRQEDSRASSQASMGAGNGAFDPLDSLFFQEESEGQEIRIGPKGGRDDLVLKKSWRWLSERDLGKGQKGTVVEYSDDAPDQSIPAEQVWLVEYEGKRHETRSTGRRNVRVDRRGTSEFETSRSLLLPFRGFSADGTDVSTLWDQIVLTEREATVVEALQVIEPETERLVLVEERHESSRSFTRIPLVKLKGSARPVPLRSLGDGMSRVFELAVGLTNVPEGGAFLVDELDSGIHYTLLADIWKMVFRVATTLDIQVFGTTHSWECIESFQNAASSTSEESVLVRMYKNKGGVFSDVFSKDDLKVITRDAIEVR